jgi:hypothetical protein
MNYEYYYNNVPGSGLCRNNLIYTSLMSADKKVFVQHYTTEGDYHKGQNQVVDPKLMDDKFQREVKYLRMMEKIFPEFIPKILLIDHCERKIYLEVQGPDFWELAGCDQANFDKVLPDWQEQMLTIIEAHHAVCLYKYSMHPSSYFIVDGKLKSINYFFTYHLTEGPISIADHTSHIYSTRQEEMKKATDAMGISWTEPQPLALLEELCWESFRKNYPAEFIERAKCIK